MFFVLPLFRVLYPDWEAKYGTLSDMVVPRSSKKLYEDTEHGLFSVTLFHKVVDEYKLHARENKCALYIIISFLLLFYHYLLFLFIYIISLYINYFIILLSSMPGKTTAHSLTLCFYTCFMCFVIWVKNISASGCNYFILYNRKRNFQK